MILRKRIDRLEEKRGVAAHGPVVIFLCSGESGKPLAALLMSGGCLTCEAGETVEAFTARADADSANTVLFNARK